ncbi:DUF6493 family protein [Streptomyces sp. NPDC088729]|uniref:DUF7824 domain-containing protein n=1 Tax=Streptomyces sp. NPDC088729 TaxID=3365876 RepID=UPI00382F1F26
MTDLLTAVNEGRHHDVPALVLRLDGAGRRSALAELKELRKEVRGWDWRRRDKVRKALLVAGASCHTGAAGCAAWIGGRDLRDWVRSPYQLILTALKDRDPAWLGDLAVRLAARPMASSAEYAFVAELARIACRPVPTTDGMVESWAELVDESRWRRRSGRVPLAEALRADPHVAVMAPRLLELPQVPPRVTVHGAPDSDDHWPAALASLADEKVLDRSLLLDQCMTRLVRGGAVGEQRFFLSVLLRLGMTDAEEGGRLRDWTAMAADGVTVVASHAQAVLTRLEERGELPTRELADVSLSVLFRPEKKLARAQLTLLGKALRRDATAAGELLPVVAEAFAGEDIVLQEQALKLVARHLPADDDALRAELSSSAARLGAVHRESVAALFGGPVEDVPEDAAPYEELLPAAPAPGPLRLAPESVAELVEEVAALLKSRSWYGASASAPAPSSVADHERLLDGLVRRAAADRAGLAAALREALAGSRIADEDSGPPRSDPQYVTTASALSVMVASLLGRVTDRDFRQWHENTPRGGSCAHTELNSMLLARVQEAADAVRTGRLPFLLATPTRENGSLDPADLIGRLRAYRSMGVEAGPADFGQALLRLCRSGGEEAAVAADALGTPEGDRVAAWLRADDPVAPLLRHGTSDDRPARGARWRRSAADVLDALFAAEERRPARGELPAAFPWLVRPPLSGIQNCYHWGAQQSAHWVTTFPEDPETLAAWLTPDLMRAADDGNRGAAWILPPLVETGGEVGPSAHLALAYGLGARHAEDRISAVDALLVLAARGRLDAALLGRALADLVDRDAVKVTRLADSTGTAAGTGAYRTVLAVLAHALPGVLASEKQPRGLGDLLSVAADCAERCGTDGLAPIAGLAATAARKGASQTVRQAGRLLIAFGPSREESGARS